MNFRELREQLTDETIKALLDQYNVQPYTEDDRAIVFPTCCHNLEGGSPKLYYYKDSKLFRCYTECNETFDIFTLLQKMHKLRGREITLRQAVQLCDLDVVGVDLPERDDVEEDLRYLQEISQSNAYTASDFSSYDRKVLNQFPFDYIGMTPWLREGIGVEALQKFNIRYDSIHDAIVIPNFDYDGRLIGIRARYFKPEEMRWGKYRPIRLNGITYAHPTGRTFYGIWENHKNIEHRQSVVIFEGEKSVLLYGTIYGNDNNIALATLGQNITRDHVRLLLKMGVHDVILAYDSDYEDYDQLREVEKRYKAKARLLSPYFNVSYLMDYDFDLPYKSSPIDGGREIFEKLLMTRSII